MEKTQSYSLPETGFVRLNEILKVIPVGRSTWWARVKSGVYPQPVKLGPRTTAWHAEQIRHLIHEMASSPSARSKIHH